ncbi:LPXTG cell wall anchor domain-containing protein [Erwinia sp. CPCC 100877]|nr:LPXTG cell wall anchor domain-containing protein [Erwinia sp. CPCC 100877]
MKKRKIKLLSLIALLTISQTNVGVFAETFTQDTNSVDTSAVQEKQTETSDSSNIVAPDAVDFSEAATTITEKAQADTELSSSEEVQVSSESEATVSPRAVSEASAMFEGQSLAEDNSIAYTWDQFMGTERFSKKLSIEAKFSEQPIANKKIVIKLSEEFEYSSLPGFKKSGGKFIFSASELPSQLASVITNATIEYPKVYNDTLSLSGTVTYELVNTVSIINMDITLGVSNKFLINENGRDYMKPIEVIYSEEGNENFYDQSFEQISFIDKAVVPRFYVASRNAYSTVYKSQTGSFITGKAAVMSTGGQAIESAGAYLDTLSYEVKYDKRLDLKKVVFEQSQSASFTELPEKEDSNYKYALISVNQLKLAGSAYYEVAFAEGVDGSTIETDTKLEIASTGGKVSYKPYKGAEVIDADLYAGITVGVQIIADFVNELTATDLTRSVSINNKSSYTYLGGFRVENNQPEVVTDQKFSATFDTDNINVQAMRIATVGQKTANIKVTTTTGRTITLPDNSSTSPTQQIIDLSEYEQQSNEYIAAVEWTDDVPASYKLISSLYGAGGIQYYGSLKAGVTEGMEITNNELKYGSIATFDNNAQSTKSIIKVTSGNVYGGVIKSTGLRVTAGNQGELHASVRVKEDAGTGVLSGFKGINIYARELDENGINIIPENFKAVDSNGNVFTIAEGNVQVTKMEDNTGETVYQFSIPDYEVNAAVSKKTHLEDVKIGVSISKVSPTATHSLADIIFMDPIDSEMAIQNTGVLMGIAPNKYELGERDAAAYLFTGLPSVSLIVQANIDLNVTTAANIDGGEFIAYNGTPSSIIDLNPEGQAQYGLKVSNNSGEAVNGFQAIIPIPKRGETTDQAFQLQDTNFGWSVNLTEPLDLSANNYDYTVLYATSYELDFNANSWKTWDEITDKSEIRAIYIQTSSSINSIENATAENPGEDFIAFNIDMDRTTADQDAGKVNIYKALIHRSIKGVMNSVPSEAVAIRLKTGIIKGRVYADDNRNGSADDNETGLNGITVTAYDKGTKNVIETTTTKTVDGVDGSYVFLGLDKSQAIDVSFKNPVTDDSRRFVKTDGITISADQLTAKIANVIASSEQSDQASVGLMSPMKVTFDAQGGTASLTEEVIGYPDSKSKINTAPTATKEGYTLEGWYTKATGGTKVAFPYEAAGKADVTLYAVYKANPYMVSFNISENGGTGTAPSDTEVNYLELITKPTDPKKEGFTFVGWYDAPTNGKKWNFEEDKMPARDLTLYAYFSVGEYVLTFDNEGEVSTQTVGYDELAEEPTAPVKNGHTFVGWYDKQTGGTQWNFAQTKMPAQDVTLYARFSINQYAVHYVIDGTIVESVSADYYSLLNKPADPSKEGYSFIGWYDEETGDKWDFAQGKVPAQELTLTARFTKNNYTLTFDNEGATTSRQIDFDELVQEPTAPVKTGYTFTGWYDEETDTKWDFAVNKMPSKNKTLIARYTINHYTVTFDYDGTTTTESVVFNELVPKPADPQTPAGYVFTGWKATSGLSLWDFDNDKMSAGDLTLVAQFDPLDQVIILDFNGGTGAGSTEITAPTDSPVDLDAIKVPTKLGYQFVGWFNGDEQVSGTISMPVGGLSLQARWEAADQVIRFESNGGIGVASIIAKTDSVVTIDDQQTTTRAGYEFLGWYDENEQQVSGEYTVPAGGAILTAKWAAQEQTITFDVNGGDINTQPTAIVMPTDTEVDLSAVANPKKAGYHFVGWFDAEGKTYSGIILMPAGGLALTAQWQQEPLKNDSTDNNDNKKDKSTTTTNKGDSKVSQGTAIKETTTKKEQSNKKILPNSGEKVAPFIIYFGLLLLVTAILGYKLKRKRV